jgi:hypothetical protein
MSGLTDAWKSRLNRWNCPRCGCARESRSWRTAARRGFCLTQACSAHASSELQGHWGDPGTDDTSTATGTASAADMMISIRIDRMLCKQEATVLWLNLSQEDWDPARRDGLHRHRQHRRSRS